MSSASTGEAVVLQLAGVSEAMDVPCGSILSDHDNPVLAASKLKAQINIVDLPPDRPLLTAGFKAVMHIHAVTIECEIIKINESTTLETGEVEQKPRAVKSGQHATIVVQLARSI